MADTDLEIGVVSKLLQFIFPNTGPVAVATPGIRSDKQFFGIGVGALSHRIPPPPDGRNRECRGIVVTSDIYPGFVSAHIVDPIGKGFARRVLGEIVHQGRVRRVLWLSFPASVLKVTDELFLFGIDRYHRLSAL